MRAGAGRAEREASMRGAFVAARKLVSGRVVLVVDDVFTTGSTLAACATALRAAGARDILALTVARAL
jgi:predicted amidophosphoribosyltransferase